jgi:signal transduction histidine kinase
MRSSEAVGQHLSDVIRSDDLLALLESPASRDTVRPPEWTTGENGDQQWFLPYLSVVHTPDGVPDGRVLALRDVSRFKRLNQNQREFMRIVAHDLRSPLTAMQGFADMIRMGMVGDLTEKQEYFVDKILSGITQMTGIVENIQDAGRFDPETGFYEMERTHVDLGEIAARIVKNQIIPAEKDNLSLALNVADDVPIINVDENMLTRAMSNLVDNAIKYTPDGGNVVINIQREDGNVVVAVVDDGNGISEEDQKRLFRRHVRLARKDHVRVKGTGLGLFIVRSVAQAHGGDAIVHSVVGEGTTFSLVIPLVGPNLMGAET